MDSGDLPFIKVSDFELPENSYRIIAANNWVADADAISMKAQRHPAGSTVFAKIGIALLSNRRRLLVRDTLIDNNLMSATPRDDTDSRFLFYLLRTLDFGRYAGGSALPYLTTKGLNAITIRVPPPSEQRAIAGVLGALDDKIDQNRRTVQTLERLARAIFRAWFVDFEPVKAKAEGATRFPSMPQAVFDALPARLVDTDIGPVPESWDVGRLDDLLVLQRGFDLPKNSRTDGIYPVMAASGRNGTHKQAKVRGPGVTTGRSGVLGNVFFVAQDFWPLNTSLWVKEYPNSNPWHAYHVLNSIDLRKYNSGSAVPTLNRNHIHTLPVVVPPRFLLDAFAALGRILSDMQGQCEEESRGLAEMRDYLLPRLLNGSVRVEAGNG
jgi:type I restriction enzyme S subunit